MNHVKVTYDGHDLGKYCYILSAFPSMSASRTSSYRARLDGYGSHFRETALGMVMVELEIIIKEDILSNLDQLNRILFTREPKPLIIHDRPDRFLYCIPKGEFKLTSRHRNGRTRLVFESPDSFWRATGPMKQARLTNGSFIIQNGGTAPTPPVFDLEFVSDCGYVELTAPNGRISLGTLKEENGVYVPKSEIAINESFKNGSLSNWAHIPNAERLILDYIKMSSIGAGKITASGLTPDTSTLGKSDKWHGYAYMKNFEMGVLEREADIFKFRSQVAISNVGGRTNMCAMLMVVMDIHGNPIMTTSVYDASSDKSELTVTFKVPEAPESKRSKIIYTGKLSALWGSIQMEKRGNTFEWYVTSNKTLGTGTVSTTQGNFRIGDKVKIKASATHAETGHPIKAGYHAKTYTIGAVKKSNGQNVYRIDVAPWPIYWMYERDIEKLTASFETRTVLKDGKQSLIHRMTSSGLGQMRPYKVLIWQAKWGSAPIYDQFYIENVVVNRLYTVNYKDLENTFEAGDHLYINNSTGEILLNERPFEGLIDYDSRFFSVDGGPTEVEVFTSKWARPPIGIARWEDRWL